MTTENIITEYNASANETQFLDADGHTQFIDDIVNIVKICHT